MSDFMPTPSEAPATGRRWTLPAARSAVACRWRTPFACTARPRELAALAGRSRLRQMQGLPSEAFDMLVRMLARICETRMIRCSARPCRPCRAGASPT